MNILLDLILVAIVVYAAYRGYRNGIIVGIIGALALVFSLYMSTLLANAYADDFTGMFKPFAGGLVDSAFSTIMSDERDESQEPVIRLTDSEKNDVYAVSHATLRQLGIAEEPSVIMAEKVAAEVQGVGQRVSEAITSEICRTLSYIIIFVIGFVLIAIIFAALGNIFNLKFSIPGIEMVDGIVGALIGAAKGFIIILVIALIIRYASVIIPDETLESTKILSWLSKTNVLADNLGL